MRDDGFSEFCKREYGPLVRALTVWCGDRLMAEDAAQEAFARAFRDWGRVQRKDRPSAWVRRVAMNQARSQYRRRRAEKSALQRLESRPQAEDVTGPADTARIRTVLDQLSEPQRTAIVLRHYLDLPIAEVADIMNRSISAVTSLTNRAVATMRTGLGPSERELVEKDP